MNLYNYLISQNLIAGKPDPSANTSNSSMGATKNLLLGNRQFVGNESYLVFGSVLHEQLQFIEGHPYHVSEKVYLLSHDEVGNLIGILNNAQKNSIVKKIIANTTREQKVYHEIEGVRVAMLLDLENPKLKMGADWKSTSCSTEQDFIKKAIAYDYIRQAVLYMWARGLKKFYFIGLQKCAPFNIYIMDVGRYTEEIAYSLQEIKFLLYFYKNYGKVYTGKVVEPVQSTTIIKSKIKMAKLTGKEALKAIAEKHKVVGQAKKIYDKEQSIFNKMLDKFPAKEKELYAEKLEKYIPVN